MSKSANTGIPAVDNVNGITKRSEVSSATGLVKAKSKSVHLYIIQSANGLVKIGRSHNPALRLRDLKNTTGIDMVLVAVFRDRGNDEMAIHKALSDYRANGEWFQPIGRFRAKLADILGVELWLISANQRAGTKRRNLIAVQTRLRRATPPKNRLTDEIIDGMAGRSKPFRIADGAGLHLYTSRTGVMSWRWRYEDGASREQIVTLGHYPDMTIEAARTARDHYRLSVAAPKQNLFKLWHQDQQQL